MRDVISTALGRCAPRGNTSAACRRGRRAVRIQPGKPVAAAIAARVAPARSPQLLIVDAGSRSSAASISGSVYAFVPAGTRITGERPPWRDIHVRIRGPLVTHFAGGLSGALEGQTGRTPGMARYFRPCPPAGDAPTGRCGVRRRYGRRNPFYTALLARLGTRRRSVFITTAYFVPATAALCERSSAPRRRGVDVRLLLRASAIHGRRSLPAGRFTAPAARGRAPP